MNSSSKIYTLIFIFIFSLQTCFPISAQTSSFFPITWNSPILLSSPDIPSTYPNIVVDTNNKTSVVWIGKIGYSEKVNYRYRNNFNSWSAIQDISTTVGVYATPEKCSMILDKSNIVHVAWLNSNYDFYYRYLNGTIWSNSQIIAGLNNSGSFSLASFLDGSIVFVWNTIYNTRNQLFSRCFYPQFNNWSDIIQITKSKGNCKYVDIAIDSTDQAHLVWVEEIASPYFSGIKYQTFNKTYTFTNETKISTLDDEEYDNPCIATDSLNNVHIVWEEKVGYPSYERGLVYRYQNNGSWSSKKYFDLYGSATNPVIMCDSSDFLHLLWSEYNSLIYNQIGENGLRSDYDFVITQCGGTIPDMVVDDNNIVHILYSADESASEPTYYGINYIVGMRTVLEPTTPPISISINLSFQTIFLMIFGINSAISIVIIYKKKKNS